MASETTVGPDLKEVAELRDLLDLMENFRDNDQRARYLLTCNWMRDRQEKADKLAIALVLTQNVREGGLFRKFRVERVDGRDQPGGDKADARYFVLDYWHDPHARRALSAYAESVHKANAEFASDLRQQLIDTDVADAPWRDAK